MERERAEFSFLDSALQRSIGDIRQAVEGSGDLGRQASQLGSYLLGALAAIGNRARELAERFSATTEQTELEALLRQLRHLNSYVRSLHETVAWLESIRSPSLSLGLAFYLQESSAAILKGEAELVLHRGAAYMYSTMGLKRPFEQLLSRLNAAVPAGATPVVVIYPSVEEERTLLHPIFMHELGHEAVERHSLRDLVKRAHPDIDDLDRRFGEAVAQVVAEHVAAGEPLSSEEAEGILRGVLDAWLDELLCDQLALGYLGPTYIFAASSFLLPTSSSEASATHPPTSIRIGYLLDFLRELGWEPFLASRVPSILGWLTGVAKSDAVGPDDHIGAFVRQAVLELAAPMRGITAQHLGGCFRPDDYLAIASQLETSLKNSIPPIQLENRAPAGRREILLACWLSCLDKLGDEPSSLHGALADLDLQRFFAKTLEMTYVLERWRVP